MKTHRTALLACLISFVSTASFALTSSRSSGPGGVVLRANVPMGSVLGTGDRISFEYQTRVDAAVVVFNIDTEGFVHLLYPAGEPEVARARQNYPVPADGAELIIDARTGVEFVFAVSVEDASVIDEAELERWRSAEREGAPRRIDGDPFVAANMLAAELIPGVSQQGAYFGYTYFYVNDRVEFPCYLCGACDGIPDDPACDDYRVVQTFERGGAIAYPLPRAYETVTEEVAIDEGAHIDVPQGSDVDVNFYPYGVEARAVDPFYTSLWNDYWWYDPWYWYGPYYPYYGPGWSFTIGWGWGWGWWGGYYCSGWYAPCGWGYDPWYGNPSGGYTRPPKFKEQYKEASSLTTNRTVAARRDGDLRIATKDVSRSFTRPTSSYRTKTSVTGSRSWGGGKGAKGAIDSPSRYRAKSPGTRSAGVKSPQRSKSSGVSNVPRGGGGYKARTGSKSRMNSGVPAPRAKSAAPSRSYTAPSRGSSMKSAPPRSSGASRGPSRGRSR
jgi:hypothetical protein